MNELEKLALRTVKILSEMSTDEFEFMKCIILANAKVHKSKNVYNFMRTVFELSEEKRPLLLGMKGGAI